MSKNPKCTDIPNELWPPQGSQEKEIVVYRAIVGYTVEESDFLSKYELHSKNGRPRRSDLDNDMYYGLSVFQSIDEAKRLVDVAPCKLKRFNSLAKGYTKSEDGLIRFTPAKPSSSHVTWWLYEGAKPQKYYNIVPIGGDSDE